VIAGSKEKFVGRIQERYGIAKEAAQRQLDDWLNTIAPAEPGSRRKSDQFAEEPARPR
jgi:hypothetical protein